MTNPKNESHPQDTPEESLDDLDIDWAEALAEQAQGSAHENTSADSSADASADQSEDAPSEHPTDTEMSSEHAHPNTKEEATAGIFQPLEQRSAGGKSDIDMIMDIPVQLSVELGRTRLTIKNILQLGQGSVVELDGLAGEPMDVFVNGYLIAQGEVVVVDDKYGIRITDIITPSDRIHRLNTRR